MELDKKLGHYEYLLLAKRSFPGSLVPKVDLAAAIGAAEVGNVFVI